MITYPELQIQRYASALRDIADDLNEAIRKRTDGLIDKLGNFLTEAQDQASFGLPDELRQAREDMDDTIDEDRLREVVASNLNSISNTINVQFNESFRQITNIQPFQNDARLERIMEQRISENVDLIKTLPERHFDEIEGLVKQAVNEGWSTERLRDAIPRQGATAEFKAERIARDQAGDLSGDITQQRFSDAGVQTFVWDAVLDSRTREGHRQANGRKFTWDEGAPPSMSETGFPGKDIQCRCVAGLPTDELQSRRRDTG